jgi:uncharacterized protein YndB with AHSA1/START domain
LFVLIKAATLPNDFRVARSIDIKAPREKVFTLINDLKVFNQWNPFAKQDPSTLITYRNGPVSGNGAAFDWQGSGSAGSGSLAIVDAESPVSITMKLDIRKPMEGHNKVVFDLQPQAQTTTVTWTMTGPYPYVNRVFGTIFNMDKMIGSSFDKGLADLKALAET